VLSIKHYVKKFVSDLRQAGLWFSPGTPVSSTNKTSHHDITEIRLKVALNGNSMVDVFWWIPGADPEFQVRGEHLKKLRRAEGGAKIFGVFRVKNHDFTPKNHIFSNFRGRALGPPLHSQNISKIQQKNCRTITVWYFFLLHLIKTKINLYHTFVTFWLFCLDPLVYLFRKTIKWLTFQSLVYKRT
jgi:hypothetical protein